LGRGRAVCRDPAAAFEVRRRFGLARPREGAMILGLAALVAVFLITLPLVASRIALAVQFQVSRVFWMLDLAATVYAVWALADAGRRTPGAAARNRRAAAVACALIGLAAARARGDVGGASRSAGRAGGLPNDDWQDAMNWLRGQPAATHVLADPSHAWREATSVRGSGGGATCISRK